MPCAAPFSWSNERRPPGSRVSGAFRLHELAALLPDRPLGECDPQISLASIASMFLGACAGGRERPCLLDVARGNGRRRPGDRASRRTPPARSSTSTPERTLRCPAEDRSPFSGGKRVLVDGLLTRRETIAVAAAGYFLGPALGLRIALAREPRGPRDRHRGNGLRLLLPRAPGETVVSGASGGGGGRSLLRPSRVRRTYLVQRGDVPAPVIVLSLPLGILIGAFLWINQFPDYRADLRAGKRTLVVRLGPTRRELRLRRARLHRVSPAPSGAAARPAPVRLAGRARTRSRPPGCPSSSPQSRAERGDHSRSTQDSPRFPASGSRIGNWASCRRSALMRTVRMRSR